MVGLVEILGRRERKLREDVLRKAFTKLIKYYQSAALNGVDSYSMVYHNLLKRNLGSGIKKEHSMLNDYSRC
jgi:hypothetical protein